MPGMKIYFYASCLAFIFLLPKHIYTQSTVCDSITPSFFVDLSGVPDSNYISPSVVREGVCCGLTITAPPPRCIEFEVILDTGAVGLAFDIYSGAEPPGALFYQVNCGPLIPIGDTICLDGVGPHTLTFCKPGANQNEYTLKSIPGTVQSSPNATRAGCDTEVTVSGLIKSSIQWRDITSPTQEYQAYLSCDTGCDTVYVTTPVNAPLFVDYEVCGTPLANFCNDSLPEMCDTVRVMISPPLIININPDPAVICTNELSRTLSVAANLDKTNFTYIWTDEPGGGGAVIGTDSTLVVTNPGVYSVIVEDTIFGECSRDTTETIVSFSPPPEILATSDAIICPGDSIFIEASGGMTYTWTPAAQVACDTCATTTAYPTSSGFFTVIGTDANGCSDTDSISVVILNTDSTFINTSICQGDSILLGGAFQTSAGQYRDTLLNQDGCDSIIVTTLSILPSYAINQSATICEGDSILLDGAFQTISGIYTDSLLTTDGCDSLIITTLTVFPIYNVNQVASICQGDSILLGGAFQTQAGVYTDAYLTADGCDSIIITTLTVLPTFTTAEAVSICSGDSIFLQGAFQTQAGIYTDVFTAANGCDSTVITPLTILPTPVINQTTSICQGDSIFLEGAFQTQAGIYTDIFTTTAGCDSTVITTLTILPSPMVNLAASICQGDSILLAGAFQTQAGVYTDSLLTADGCDSLIITTLSVLPIYNINLATTICQGDSILLGGAFQTQSGIYTDAFLTADGCDSIISTTLTVLPSFTSTPIISICEGDSIFLQGAFQTQAGTYTDVFTAANGCDSTVITTLDILPAPLVNQTASICEGDSIFLAGSFQTLAGVYTDIFTTANGCDSTVITTLTVLPSFTVNLTSSICEGDSILIAGAFRTQAGIYTDSLLTADGCDSLIINTLAVFPTYNINLSTTICQGDSILLGGAFQTQSGVYMDAFLSADGCDSIITTTLTVLPTFTSTPIVSICEGDSIFLQGAFQTQAGNYTDIFTANNGCDSTVITTLNVLPTPVSNQSATICQGDSIFLGGNFQTQAGIYTDVFTASNGCDSLVMTTLTVLPSSTTNLTASICQGDSILIAGVFRTQVGVYTDSLLTVDGCDSLIITTLSVFPSYNINQTASICDGDSIFLGGAFQTQAGVYVDVFLTADGCDSIINTTLTILPSFTSTPIISICEGDSIFLQGAFQTQAGTYSDLYTATNGCDSTVITTLNVLPTPVVNQAMQMCQGDSIFLGGAFQTQTGIYTDIFSTIDGCDSTVITTLTVFPTSTVNLTANICEGDSLLIAGAFRTQAGVYTDSLLNSEGCDSLVHTTLTVFPTYTFNFQESICEGDSLLIAGAFRTQTGVYIDSFLTVDGCDSLIFTSLMVMPSPVVNLTTVICGGDSVFLQGAWQKENGIYTDSLLTNAGCDSVVITDLQVLQTYIMEVNEIICQGDSLFVGGAFQTEQGIYTDIYTATNGCDSIIHTELILMPQPILEIIPDIDICLGEEVELWANGRGEVEWAPAEGLSCTLCANPIASPQVTTTYTASIPGCGGRIIQQLVTITVHDPPQVDAGPDQTIYQGEEVELFAGILPPDSMTISWSSRNEGILCASCNPLIVSPKNSDTYTVTVTDEYGCMDSDVMELIVLADCIKDVVEIPNLFTPNGDGINDEFYLRNLGPGELKMLRIYNRWGQLVFETKNISEKWDGTFNGQSCNPGVFAYYLEITCPNSRGSIITGDITLLK